MKLTLCYFFPVITDQGIHELLNYVDSILYKNNKGVYPGDYEDIKQEMILACLEALPEYDQNKCDELGGYLYWKCRGAITKWQNKRKRCVPTQFPILEKMQGPG